MSSSVTPAHRFALRLPMRRDLTWVEQAQQLGTGHAVAQALPAVAADATVLVAFGDVPLVKSETLSDCVAAARAGSLAVVTADMPDPTGLGRIIRGADGRMMAIVEQRDATPEQRAITEINSGIMAAPAQMLRELLGQLGRNNQQGEFYLTDVVGLAVARGHKVEGRKVALRRRRRRHQRSIRAGAPRTRYSSAAKPSD